MLIELSLLIGILPPPALFKLSKIFTRLSGICTPLLGVCPGLTMVFEPADAVGIDWFVALRDRILGKQVIAVFPDKGLVVHFFFGFGGCSALLIWCSMVFPTTLYRHRASER